MNGSAAKIQAWLTPSLITVGVLVGLYVAQKVDALDGKLDRALLKIERHQTILEQRGLVGPGKLP